MEASKTIKLLQTPMKPVTPVAERPAGCYCDKVQRRCGVCARASKKGS